MLNPFTWFRRNDDHDFQAVFERLDASIQTRTDHLAEIKQREHKAVVLFTSWSLGLWAVYVAIWYSGALTGPSAFEKAFFAAPLAIGPVLTIFTRRTFKWWYRRKQNKEDAELKVLRKKQAEQVEKFKKLTRYEETRTLLEKYDEKTRIGSLANFPLAPLRGSPGRGGTPRGSPTSRGRGGYSALAPAINAQFATPTRGGTGTPLNGSPASRGWVDRFADRILGDDETAPQNKYALICGKCFAHNGLVLKPELATTQYSCPKCGHFNPPKPQSAVEEPTPSGMPRARTYSALSPMAQSSVFGRHNHRHSMVELPNMSLRPAMLPRRPSSAGEVERVNEEPDDDDEMDTDERAMSEPSLSPVQPMQPLPVADAPRRRKETLRDKAESDDGMDEG